MADTHKNFAYSTVLTAPSPASSGTSLVVQSTDGTLFPAVPFNITVWPAGAQPTSVNSEIVRVTTIATDTFTITRTQEGTSARTIVVGDQVAATITNKTLTDAEPAARNYFENIPHAALSSIINATALSKTPFFTPFFMEGSMSGVRSFNFYASRGTGTSLNLTGGIAFYSLSNSTKLNMLSSESFAMSVTTSAAWSGLREYNIALSSLTNMALTNGQWYLGMYLNGSNDSSAVMNLLLMGATSNVSNLVGSVFAGTNSTGATNNTNQFFPMNGSFSSTLAANVQFPASVGQSDVSGSGAANAPLIYFQLAQ